MNFSESTVPLTSRKKPNVKVVRKRLARLAFIGLIDLNFCIEMHLEHSDSSIGS
jgi:hypothetical protein